MELKFEKFIKKREFSKEANILFQEGIACYKFSAYRASLLMCYLGFMQLIKDKILYSPEPCNGYSEERWKSDILSKLKDEEYWEKQTFEILKRSKNPIFNVNENLKTQLEFWRGRRNDCAHFKNNSISSCHIEAFLEFIESNIDKFIINEGVDHIVNQFINSFKYKYNEENINTLISKIFVIFNEDMFEEFVEKLFIEFSEQNYTSSIDPIYNTFGGYCEEIKIIFIKLLLKVDGYTNLERILHNIILKNKGFYLDLCDYDPKIYTLLPPSKEIEEVFYGEYDSYYKPVLFKYFIKNIPNEVKEDAYSKFLKHIDGDVINDLECRRYMYEPFMHELKNHVLKRIGNFEWANKNKYFCLELLGKPTFDEDVIEKLNEIFDHPAHPFDLKRLFIKTYPELFKL